MPLLLWAKPPIFAATTLSEFIDWLRYRAIDFGMPPQFIDCVDDLHTLCGADTEIAELKEELDLMEDQRDALRAALKSLLADPNDDDRREVAQGVLDELV